MGFDIEKGFGIGISEKKGSQARENSSGGYLFLMVENMNDKWHLSKSFSVSIIIVLVSYLIVGVYSFANLERDILENTSGREESEEQIKKILTGVRDIREGLISKGIIKPQ